jgi:hypothetical protein
VSETIGAMAFIAIMSIAASLYILYCGFKTIAYKIRECEDRCKDMVDGIIRYNKGGFVDWDDYRKLDNRLKSVERKFSLDHVQLIKLEKQVEELQEKCANYELTFKILHEKTDEVKDKK